MACFKQSKFLFVHNVSECINWPIFNFQNVYILRFLQTSFFILLFATFAVPVFATHNRAGEITYEQIAANRIRMTLTTYTKTSSSAADRDSIEIVWGDGTSQWVQRSNGTGQPLPNDVKLNKYIQEHTYPGRGTYTITFTDENRIGNILNVNFPNSIDIALSLSTTFTLLDPQFQGVNNSVVLLQPPIDFACLNQRFIHNPNAYDPDGDSLSYELAIPLQDVGSPVPNYFFPDQILPGSNNLINLDPITGDFTWISPPQQGEYNIAIRINEYRKGVLITSVVRDMQILVRACMNQPPVIEIPEQICVIAGTKISIPVGISDPDMNQNVELTASGAPFLDGNNAVLIGGGNFKPQPYTALFEWQTDCNDVSKNFYKIVFRAVDNYFGDTTGLATIKTLLIKVVGPPPEDVTMTNDAGAALITWESPYQCENASDEYFLGFSVWRSNRSVNVQIDTCEGGLQGYEKIVFNTRQQENGRYFYRDDNVAGGEVYCYRIIAEFAKYTNSGNPFNIVESLPSEEVCFTLSRNIPLLTKVSVATTGANGSIELAFVKPDLISLDTVTNPGPYRIEVLFKPLLSGNFTIIPSATKLFNVLSNFSDTTFLHNGVNTTNSAYEYQLKFYSGDRLLGTTAASSSVFLTVSPSQMRNALTWTSQTAWTNNLYYIYRRNNATGVFQLIDSTDRTNYTDFDLTNGTEYCYKVQSSGTYGLQFVPTPLLNFSQESCGSPFDNLPPCAPKIEVNNLCDQLGNIEFDQLENVITWTDPNAQCPEIQTISAYVIYYVPDSSGNFQEIGRVNANQEKKFIHGNLTTGLLGCYALTALDEIGNESELSNIVCKENCPIYELPNTFTPNGDGANDVFEPVTNFFISRIDMKIFNEWGTMVFSTNEPSINWTGLDAPTGTYYYICSVFNQDLSGQEVQNGPILRGYINLLR